jgi:hypothetical protein
MVDKRKKRLLVLILVFIAVELVLIGISVVSKIKSEPGISLTRLFETNVVLLGTTAFLVLIGAVLVLADRFGGRIQIETGGSLPQLFTRFLQYRHRKK